ncbi:sensor histidine kinase [Paenibacillus andongensis]|uniref:sensor histidine kinase n=1 Tax=Paenibacillus andongensis TaxID=2975482 RepID=UPI0021BB37E9|nr:sensor histidine kinase [Paenibacillus andongensis]
MGVLVTSPKKLYVLFLVFIFSVLLPGASVLGKDSQPEAVKGILDLSKWNWEYSGLAKLDGEWELVWSKFLTPDEFGRSSYNSSPTYAQVPKEWKGLRIDGGQLSNQGYATYRLRIRTDSADIGKDMGLYVPSVATAYKLWIDGRLAAVNGVVGTSKEEMVPANFPKPVFFHLQRSQTELVIQVSNFVQRKGGLWEAFRLGNSQEVIYEREKEMTSQLLIVGSLFTMGLYHMGLFLARRKDKSPLVFGFFSFAIGIRTMVTGQTLVAYLFPHISWEIQVHMEYLSASLSMIMFALFVYYRYPAEMHKGLRNLFVGVLLAYSLFVLVTHASVYTYTMLHFQLVILALIGYALYVFVRAFMRKREGARLNMAAVVVFLVFALNDVLFDNRIIANGHLVQVGMLFYVFMESVNLSHQFSKSFARVETLSAQLQEWNDMLEEKVQERTEALEQSNESMQRVNKELVKMETSRRHMLSNISHELGTPLTLIQGYVKAVLDRIDEDNHDRYLRLTYEKTLILDRIIGDLFELSKLETGKIRFDCQAVAPAAYIRSLYNKYELSIKQEGFIFEFIDRSASAAHRGAPVWIDVVRIEQVVTNLLFNARKFTPPSGFIYLIVEQSGSQEKGDLGVRITVQDSGRGIDEEDLPFVFDRFYRGKESSKNSSTGSGLGLAICKEIIAHHGGTIEVESKAGSGSAFTFTLPVMNDMEGELGA